MGRHPSKSYPWQKENNDNDSISRYSISSWSRSRNSSEDSDDTPKAADPPEDLESHVFGFNTKISRLEDYETQQEIRRDEEATNEPTSFDDKEEPTKKIADKEEDTSSKKESPTDASPRTSIWWEPRRVDSAPRWWETKSSVSEGSHSVRSLLSRATTIPPPLPLRSSGRLSLPGAFPVAGINSSSDGNRGGEERFEDEPSTTSRSARDEFELLLEATLVSEKSSRLDAEQRSNELVFQAEPLQIKRMFTLRFICGLVCLLLLIAVVGIAVGTEVGRRRYEIDLPVASRNPTDLPIDFTTTFVPVPSFVAPGNTFPLPDDYSSSSNIPPVMEAPPKDPSRGTTLAPSTSVSPTNYTSTSEQSVTTINPDLLLDALPDKTKKSLSNPGSPQFLAYKWLTNDPQLNKYKEGQQVQRFALAVLYFATGGQDWEEAKNWLSYGVEECDWYSDAYGGLLCEEDSDNNDWYEILSVNQNNHLNGTLPDEVWLLTTLVALQLNSHEELEGKLPTKIGKMLYLESLVLMELDLAGSIPKEIGLTKLKSLHVGGNSLTGPLPSEIGNIQQLQHLFVNDNQLLNGTLPTELGRLAELEELAIQNNSFVGTIPSQVGLLDSLQVAYFGFNKLTGMIPAEMGNLSDLRALILQSNFLKGPIPDLSGLSKLEYAFFGLNNLTGTIPVDVMAAWESLLILDLGNNDLSGTIPAETGLIHRLQHLDLFNNTLSGPVPLELGKLHNAEKIMLEQNRLTGTIPSTFGVLTNLKRLWLHDNDLTGTVPIQVCTLVEAGSLVSLSVDCFKVHCDCGCDCSMSMPQLEVNEQDDALMSREGSEGRESLWDIFVEWVTGLV